MGRHDAAAAIYAGTITGLATTNHQAAEQCCTIAALHAAPSATDIQLALSQCAPSLQINEQPQPLPTGSGEIESPLVVGRVGVQLAPDPRPVITAGMPLGHSLPEMLKQDIWEDRSIDMAALLYAVTHTTYGIQLGGDLENGQGLGEIQLTHQR